MRLGPVHDMASSVTLRMLERSDIPLIAIWLAELPLLQHYQFTREKAQIALDQGLQQSDILIVCDLDKEDDRACGLAWLMPRGGFGRSAYLRLLAVQEVHLKQGIGSALLAEAERLAAQFSLDMMLLVSDFNTDAQRFYRHHGYEQVGAIPGYVLPHVTELLFRKLLTVDSVRGGAWGTQREQTI